MPLRSLFFALLAVACASAPRGVSPSAPGAVEATPATSARQTLALDPSEITWDTASNVAIFEPDRGVQRAAYETWRLDLASLERALGGRPTAPVSVIGAEAGRSPASGYSGVAESATTVDEASIVAKICVPSGL